MKQRFPAKRFCLMLAVNILAAVLLIVGGQSPSVSAKEFPGKAWEPVQSLEQAGWNPEKLQAAQELFLSMGSTAVMVIDDGYVVAAWGDTATPARIHSVRKSLQSALYGIYTAQGKIRLDATLEELGIDDKPPGLTTEEKQATVRHLLQARSGVYHPAAYETPAMKNRRPERGSHLPGTHWYYNNWDFNTLGAIFAKTTKLSLFEAFEENIAKPLGMQDFSLKHTEYHIGAESDHPALLYKLSCRDMARFGLLFLRQGEWNGRQIIPVGWVAESTTVYSQARGIGYGYAWWVSEDAGHFGTHIKGRAFSARGNGGQFIVVLPEQKLVVVHTNNRQHTKTSISTKQFGQLFKLIMQAKERQL